MNVPVKLLEPSVQKERIMKDKYSTLSSTVQMIAQNYSSITKVTISPRREPGPGVCRVKIVTPANLRDGNLILENAGRVPVTAPPVGQDDLRPIVFYAFGTGSQVSKVTLEADHNNYVQTVFKIE